MRNLILAQLVFFAISFSNWSQVPSSWQGVGIGGGGALFAPSINPLNPAEFYIASDMGGLYQSVNSGNDWSLQHFNQVRGGTFSKVNFTSNPSIRYSINYKSGTQDYVRPSKSIDGGITWQFLPGNPNDAEKLFALYANFNQPDQVIINDWNNIYFSSDGGNSFNLVYTGMNSNAGCKLSGVFWDGNTIYCGTNDGIIKSVDGGLTFSLWSTMGIQNGQVISSFSGAKEGNVVRLFALTSTQSDVYNGDVFEYFEYGKEVYKMDNYSGNWENVTSNFNFSDHYVKFLCTAENDINTVYLAGGSLSGLPTVLKSSNAGGSWNSIFLTTNNQNIETSYCGYNGDFGWYWAELFFGMTVNPINSNQLLVTDYGFVHGSFDGGVTWSQMYSDSSYQNNSGINTLTKQVHKSAGDLNQVSVWQVFWQDSLTIWAPTSDIKGVISIDGGNEWSFDYLNHTDNSAYRIVKNPVTNTMYMATSSVHDLYQSTRLQNAQLDAPANNGAVKYSDDNGHTWQILKDFSDIVAWVAIDPNQLNTVYASVVNSSNGNGGIWVTENAQLGNASTWTKLSNPPRTTGHPHTITVLNDGQVLVSYNGHRNPGFLNSSGAFLYDPITQSWSDRSDSSMYYWTQDVVVDPNDVNQNTWYACVYDGWGGVQTQGVGGVYKTSDRGISWTKIWSNERCMSITIASNANQAYITTEYDGLFYSDNISSNTPSISQTNFPFRNTLRTFFNPFNNEIWVSTFGGGMFKGAQVSTSNVNELVWTSGTVTVFPNPAQLNKDVRIQSDFPIKKIILFDFQGKEILTKNLDLVNEDALQIPDGLVSGIYLIEVETTRSIKMAKCLILAD